jgi:hypothetical protein
MLYSEMYENNSHVVLLESGVIPLENLTKGFFLNTLQINFGG